MAGREEVDALLLDPFLAIERAEEGASAGNAGQVIDQSLGAQLDQVGGPSALLLGAKAETGEGAQHDLLRELLEVGGDAGQDACRHRRAVGLAVELVPGCLVDAVAGGVGGGEHGVELGSFRGTGDGRLLDLGGERRQLVLEPGERLGEEADPLVELGHRAAQPAGRLEIDDLGGHCAADAVQAADPLLHLERAPRQVEEHQTVAELEVAPLAAALR